MAFTWVLKISILEKSFKIMHLKLLPHCPGTNELTHWGQVMHICVSKLTINGWDNGLSPGWRQAIIWTNHGILLIQILGTNFSEIFSKIHTFSFRKMHLKMTSGIWRPFCHGLNQLIVQMDIILRLPDMAVWDKITGVPWRAESIKLQINSCYWMMGIVLDYVEQGRWERI